MKYFLIEITTKDETTAKAIYEYADLDECLKAYHNTLAYNIGLVDKVMAIILTDFGDIYIKERWEKEVDTPVHEEEVE